jgi:phage-related protein
MNVKESRQLIYLGSSKKDAEKLPQEIKELFSSALKMALNGETHEDAKPFKYHGSGVFEVVGDYRGNAFREIYTTHYTEVVFVIHIFQKKSKKGSKTPQEEKDLIQKRLKWAEQVYKELYGKKNKKS